MLSFNRRQVDSWHCIAKLASCTYVLKVQLGLHKQWHRHPMQLLTLEMGTLYSHAKSTTRYIYEHRFTSEGLCARLWALAME